MMSDSNGTTEKNKPTMIFHTLQVDPRLPLHRAHVLIYSFAILALFYHRSVSLLNSPTLLSFSLLLTLLISELVFAFMWAITQALRWHPVRRKEFPDRLSQAVYRNDLPALDVFICTADPHKEPPMSVVSTALSVMAFDYPTEKLSVYVSDDGGSELTFFAFMEAAKFARYWLPFCREKGLDQRCPDVYFRSSEGDDSEKMKMMYQAMKEKVESVVQRGRVYHDLFISEEEYEVFKKWDGFTRHDHPSIIKVLVESGKDVDITGNVLPNLVYISREKRRATHHHFKAGALNALIRVSSIMTNAPVILTLDCDMYSNDPLAPHRALCYLLDPELSSKLAFVQFPQRFQGINKNDIYGSEIKQLFQINARGMDGLQGPNYVGTGCFHSRRSFYGNPSSAPLPQEVVHDSTGLLRSEAILRRGQEVTSCTYEHGTKWGSMMGFRYGSLVEDFNTGYHLHCQGWSSVFCYPERPAFLGDVPLNLNDVLSQCKRWCVGLLEVAISRYSPLTFGTKRASFLMGLCYSHYAYWGSWCIPITTYALLPQLALIYQHPLFPKASDPWFYVYAYLFLAAYSKELADFLAAGGTIQRWWSDQRMWMIRGITSYLFGVAQFTLNQMGISAPGFNVTNKATDDEQSKRYQKGVFDFGVVSPFFVSLGVVAVLNLSSVVVGIARVLRREGGLDEMLLQLLVSGFVVVNCWPIYEAMVLRKDGGSISGKVTSISFFIAGVLCSLGYYMFSN